jgi:hypothetical protein
MTMPRRILIIVAAVLLVAVGWVAGGVVRSRGLAPPVRTAVAPVLSTAVPGTTPNPADQVEVTVSSDDVPGCIAEGQPFRGHVRSRWGTLGSDITLTYQWTKAPAAGSILVQLAGNAHQAEVKQGNAFPNVDLRLPLGGQTVTVPLTTFVFDHWDSSGRACFVWLRPPNVPQRFNPEGRA